MKKGSGSILFMIISGLLYAAVILLPATIIGIIYKLAKWGWKRHKEKQTMKRGALLSEEESAVTVDDSRTPAIFKGQKNLAPGKDFKKMNLTPLG